MRERRTRVVGFVSVLLVCSTLAGCSLFASEPDQPKPASIVVAAGEQFTIVVDANHSTGFVWELGKEPDPAVAWLVDKTYEQEPNAAPGTGGKEVWTFAANSPGWSSVQLVYRRPWEEMVPARIAEYSVDVR